MKQIPLTQGKFAIVDDEDFERLSKFKWFASKVGSGAFYAMRTIREGGCKRILPMQNAVMSVQHGVIVDHIDRNRLNNRRDNLRICTQAQNSCNRSMMRNNTSGFKGVSRHGKKWQSRIKLDGKSMFLGYFNTKEEAARAYDAAAVKFHGEFASLNFKD